MNKLTTDKIIVFTNGIYRIPHAGHSWLHRWAKSQGDFLIVAINSDESAKRIRPGQFILPIKERFELITSQEAVDCVIVFDTDTPEEYIKLVQPDILVKGHEYNGKVIPGSNYAGKVLFAPPGPFEYRHSTSLQEELEYKEYYVK